VEQSNLHINVLQWKDANVLFCALRTGHFSGGSMFGMPSSIG